MTENGGDVGGLNDDNTYGSMSWSSGQTCSDFEQSTFWEYTVMTHADNDQSLSQAYDEVRENKQNQWHTQCYFPNTPESLVPDYEQDNYPPFPTTVEYDITQGKDTSDEAVQFSDPYPNNQSGEGQNWDITFALEAGASLPGVPLGASFGIGFKNDSVYYDQSYGESHHSYWSIEANETEFPKEPENVDNFGVDIDVEAYSIPPATEHCNISSKFTFAYYTYKYGSCPQQTGPGLYYKETDTVSYDAEFDVIDS